MSRPESPLNKRFSRRLALGGAAGLGIAGVGIGLGTLPALAAPKRPRIYSTSEWGARRPTTALHTINRRPTVLVVHHTASGNTNNTSLAAAYAIARSIQNQHIGQGWGDSGQQFTISRGGHILEARTGTLKALGTRKSFIQGIHAPGSNETGIGIENEGMYTESLPPKAQWDALVSLLAYLCWAYDIAPSRIIGHKDSPGSATRCPGEAFHARLAKLRADVTAALKPKATVVPVPTKTTKAPTKTPTSKPTASKSPSKSPTASQSPTRRPSPTGTPEKTPTQKATPERTATPRRTPEPTASPTTSPTRTPTPRATDTPTATSKATTPPPTTPPPTTPPPTTPTAAPVPPQEVPVPTAGHRAAPNEAPLAAEGVRETAAGGSKGADPSRSYPVKESSGGLASTGASPARSGMAGGSGMGAGLGLGGLALAVGAGFLARRSEVRAAEERAKAASGTQSS